MRCICFACAWQTSTFTYLCTSMLSGPRGLRKDTQFITGRSSSKKQVVQLVKKFPVFYGTQKFITDQHEQVRGYVYDFRIYWVFLRILSFAPFHDDAGYP
jgi:hypothetical protein